MPGRGISSRHMADDAQLSRVERIALKFGEFANEDPRGKWLQNRFLRGISYVWVRAGISKRMIVEGLDDLMALQPRSGVMIVANHRSFFDSYAMLLACYMGPVPWARSLQFPVRSNFFYDKLLGIAINAGIAGGAMYPPIFRDKERRALNDEALDRMVEILQRPGSVLGMHPEGTRGKGPDPYELLPAQPGAGKVALLAQPMVIPAFINGLGNNIVEDIRVTRTRGARREHAIVAVFGRPLDYSMFLGEKPRPTLYKKCADLMMARVKELSLRERELRAQVMAGEVPDDDPRWIDNRGASKLYAHEG